MPVSNMSIHTILEALACTIKEQKNSKSNEEVDDIKISLFSDDKMVHAGKPKENTELQ